MATILRIWPIAAAVVIGAPSQATVPEIIVTAQTPLDERNGALGTQVGSAADIAAMHALDLSEYLGRRLGSVYINATQSNPLQPDVNYRGFTASPLLGTPQGLSVFLDGVRQNQPFGDVVSWDLIPRDAILVVDLVPGSNPLFGRNSLGGALAIHTRDGRDGGGTSLEANYGSHRRWRIEAETAGSHNEVDWFITANHFQERGWRDFSPSNADQVFAKLGWGSGGTRLEWSASFAESDLNGNGLQDVRLLAADYASVYTQPDNSQNRSYASTLSLRHDFGSALTLHGNVHYRHIRSRTYNGDINDDALGGDFYQPDAVEQGALAAAGYTGFPVSGETQDDAPFPKWRCIANILLDSEPNETCNGLINRSATEQHDLGGSAELSWITGNNRLVVGGTWEVNRAHFRQSSQFGYLTPAHGVNSVTGPGAFADGSQNSEDAFDARADLVGRTDGVSLFAADTLRLLPRLSLAISGRYDRTIIRNSDVITPGGGPGSLDGHYRYNRFNPAATLTFIASPTFTAYATLGQSSRAPSAIELGCADPANPCRLPNALAGDPPLKQVVTRTGELGAHGRVAGVGWTASAFRADNHDDILFVADDASGFGYFRNFGRTRRQGVELGLDATRGRLTMNAHYTWLDATYRTAETVDGSANSSNDATAPGFEGDIDIDPGNRIPLVPHHIFKASAALHVTGRFSISADLVAQSGMIARGNENGEHHRDGVYYLGSGRSRGYAIVNLGLDWRRSAHLKFYAELSNAFDNHYFSAAQLSPTGFNANGNFVGRPFAGPVVDGERPLVSSTFYSPGTPRSLWLGARVTF
ncbi:TonB-dependent receptor [Sphingomonas crusticola]|uniref:TonB-dependent receptor n=1 Tax=Sphingomonas crusticola TaxID=1697973 RepID=UPI000E286110|nr:TonB-dependent receptor [Sphingomonas crusticola]